MQPRAIALINLLMGTFFIAGQIVRGMLG